QNPPAGLRNLLVRLASCPAFEIVEPISCENQMRMRIDKSRHHYTAARINNFCVANILFDLIVRTDFLDLPVADEHSSVANDPELRQFCPDAGALWSAQRDELRSVQEGE